MAHSVLHIKTVIITLGEFCATCIAFTLGWTNSLSYLLVDYTGIVEANAWLDLIGKGVGIIAASGMAYYWWFRKIFKKKE